MFLNTESLTPFNTEHLGNRVEFILSGKRSLFFFSFRDIVQILSPFFQHDNFQKTICFYYQATGGKVQLQLC
jgi:hypothetical protein